jgi:hypothetical protein
MERGHFLSMSIDNCLKKGKILSSRKTIVVTPRNKQNYVDLRSLNSDHEGTVASEGGFDKSLASATITSNHQLNNKDNEKDALHFETTADSV